MKIDIYYFSGTGNSLALARNLAEKMNANMIAVSELMDLESIETLAETIGIIFPLYDFKPPKLIEEFISRIKNINTKYIFAVCTYGITPLKAMVYLDKIILIHEGKLSGGFAVKMPHNGIGSSVFSEKQYENLFKNSKLQIERIKDYVIERQEGELETSNAFISLVISGLFFQMIPTFIKLLTRVLFKGWESLALNIDDKCIGCGSCIGICPVNNIRMVDNKPYWGKQCIGCMACLNWCPKDAVKLGKSNINIRKYHHPDVKLEDMLRKQINLNDSSIKEVNLL